MRAGALTYTVSFDGTQSINDISDPIPACLGMTIWWERPASGAAAVTAYEASSTDNTFTLVEASTTIQAFTATAKSGQGFSSEKAYVRFVVDTVETQSTPSTATIVCSNIAWGGDGLLGSNVNDPSSQPLTAYRTVVVFGDTQALATACVGGSGGRCAEWDASLDWIRDNKTAENIDLVLFVGDLINNGTPLPTSSECDAVNGGATPSDATCLVSVDETTCNAMTEHCYWYPVAGDCISCNRTALAEGEWTEFDARTARLEPTGDIDIPWAATKGNHDNAGNENAIDTDREPTGWDQRYGAAYWQGLEAGYGGTSVYEHLATNADAGGAAHSWKVKLGTQDVLVIAIPYVSGSGISAAMQTWAGDQCMANPTMPAILLAHDAGQVNTTITSASETFCPNLIAVHGGHTGLNTLTTVVDGSNEVLVTVNDWTNIPRNDANGFPQDDYIMIARYDLTANPTTLEVFDYSVAGDANDSDTVGNSFPLATWDITTPAPYDLSGFEADMVLAFDNNSIARPAWPIPPTITSTCNVTAGDEVSLNACLDMAGAHIVIPAGEYDGPFTFDQSDQWVDMDNAANLNAGITISGDPNRVKITGGNFIGGSVENIDADDLLIDNVNMLLKDSGNPLNERSRFATCGDIANVCTRVAVVNTTCRATTACAITTDAPQGAASSLIFANFDAWSEFTPEGTGNDEYVSRLQNTGGVIIVDSHYRVYPTGKPPQRFHYGSTATLVADNTFEGSGTGFTNFWIDTDAGGGEQDDIDNMFILRNLFYQHGPTKISDINIDDSTTGNGIDVVLVHLEDNISRHINTAGSFLIGGNWNGVGQDCGGRDPCLRNINNTTEIVPGLTLIPFTGGADH